MSAAHTVERVTDDGFTADVVESDVPVLVDGGREFVLALEGLDLLDGDLELMRDPGIRAALAYPGADLVQVGA